jgi:parallel beta-helix repeat protein
MYLKIFCSCLVIIFLNLSITIFATVYHVDQNSDKSSDSNPGTEDLPFKTISAAAELAGPGDTVLVHPGIYRERVSPAKGGQTDLPIVYKAILKGGVIVKGSEVWNPSWIENHNFPGVYSATIDITMFADLNPFATGLSIAAKDKQPKARPFNGNILPYTLGQIFVNGVPMIQSMTIKDVYHSPGSWIVSADGKEIVLHFPDNRKPEDCMVEISTRDRVFCPIERGLSFITIQNFIFEHCANQGPFPQGGMVSVRSGKNWIIENNIIRYAKTIGLDCGSETWNVDELKNTREEDKKLMIGGNHIIKNNIISDNGLCGIAGWNHKGTKITGNLIERNNRLTITKAEASWEEWGAIKLHATDSLVEGNLIRDNDCFGIWIDNGYRNARISRNVLIGNRGAGVFLELGAGKCLIDNNIIFGTTELGSFYPGFGIYAHDASDVVVAHNLIVGNAGAGVMARKVSDRKFMGEPAAASRVCIRNNIIVKNGNAIALPFPYKYSKNCDSDFNAIMGNDKTLFCFIYSVGQPGKDNMETTVKNAISETMNKDFIVWQNTRFMSWNMWRAVTGWDKSSIAIEPGKYKFIIKSHEPSVRIHIGTDLLLDMRCKPVPEVDKDFNGCQLKQDHILPGPFQDLDIDWNYKRL